MLDKTRIARAFAALAAAALLFGSPQLQAQTVSPLQSGAYMPAITGIRDMATPPPGLFIAWYNLYTSAGTYVDRNGDAFNQLRLSAFDPSLPDLDVDLEMSAFATVPVLFWASPFTLLGGARYMVSVSPSWVTADYTIAVEPGGPGSDPDANVQESGSVSGWGDLFVSPVGLSWQRTLFDVTASYGFYAPTGRYTPGADDNMGSGRWTHQFQGMGYYYPSEDRATAFMLGGTFEFAGAIEGSDVVPGERLTFEWGLSQYLSDRLEVGIQGGHNWQVGDDSGSDVDWDPSFHDKKGTIVLGAGYWAIPDRLYIGPKYGFDFGARQRFDGYSFMLNVLITTGWLEGS